jgi:hypothetical protein
MRTAERRKTERNKWNKRRGEIRLGCVLPGLDVVSDNQPSVNYTNTICGEMAEESLKQMRLFRETTAGNGRTETIIATEMVLTCSDAVKASYPGKDNHISGRNPYLSAQKKTETSLGSFETEKELAVMNFAAKLELDAL